MTKWFVADTTSVNIHIDIFKTMYNIGFNWWDR